MYTNVSLQASDRMGALLDGSPLCAGPSQEVAVVVTGRSSDQDFHRSFSSYCNSNAL